MKINGNEKGDWSYPIPDEGEHIVQFVNSEVFHNENSGKDSLRFDTIIVEGDCIDMSIAIFVPMHNKFGVRKLSDILVCTGIAGELEKRFPGDNVELWDENVIDEIGILISDKYAKITIQHGEYNGKTSANVVSIEKIRRKKDNQQETIKKPVEETRGKNRETEERKEEKEERKRPGRPIGSGKKEEKKEEEWEEENESW